MYPLPIFLPPTVPQTSSLVSRSKLFNCVQSQRETPEASHMFQLYLYLLVRCSLSLSLAASFGEIGIGAAR